MKSEIIEFYSKRFDEDRRHDDPFGVIQELRTKTLLNRYIENDRLKVLDIGGATGIYSFYLAAKGHRVTLLDISPNHIETANERNRYSKNKLFQIINADIFDYKTEDKFDIIILHGPLYHIQSSEARISLLTKLKNFITKNGIIFGFAINRYAGYFYGIRSGAILEKYYKDAIINEIQTGIRSKSPGWYFHYPSELREEFQQAGFSVITVKSVTTQVWMIPNIDKLISDNKQLDVIIDLCNDFENELLIGQDLCLIGGN